jgi:hypothetical protein
MKGFDDETMRRLWETLVGFPVEVTNGRLVFRWEYLPKDFAPEYFQFPENSWLRIYRGIEGSPDFANLSNPGTWWSARESCAKGYTNSYRPSAVLTGLVCASEHHVRQHLRDLIDDQNGTFYQRGGYRGEGDHPQLELGRASVVDVQVFDGWRTTVDLFAGLAGDYGLNNKLNQIITSKPNDKSGYSILV